MWLPGVLIALGGFTACSDEAGGDADPAHTTPSPDAPQPTAPWSVAGLVDGNGTPVDVREPSPPTGERIDVRDFGADPAPGTGDDAPALREALDQAGPGDAVVAPAGTYDLETPDPDDETTQLTLRTGVSLIGDGLGQTILLSHFDGEDDSAVLRGEAVDDVRVEGLTVTSTYDGDLGTDIEDEDAGGGPMFGIMIGEVDDQGSARVLVQDVRVELFQRHGISVKASREVTVRGNEVADATSVGPGGAGYGIAIEGRADQRDPDASNDSRHNVVVENVLDGEHLRHAILLQFPTHNNVVADNVVHGSHLDAIDLHGEGEYLNEVRGNTVVGGERAAIALGNPGGSTHEHGASGEGNWVHDNVLVSNTDGIVVMLGTPDTLIENNRIVAGSASRRGIVLEDAPGTRLRDNTLPGRGDEFVPLDD